MKAKILMSRIHLDVLKKSEKDPCGVFQTRVGSNDNILWWLQALSA